LRSCLGIFRRRASATRAPGMVPIMHSCARGREGQLITEARVSQRASEGESLVRAVVGEAASGRGRLTHTHTQAAPASVVELDALADALAARTDARDWSAACAAAEDLARQRSRLELGAWRLPLGTAVVLCLEAAAGGGDWARGAPSTAEGKADGAPPAALPSSTAGGAGTGDVAGAEEDGWRRLAVASMRLLAGWFGLLVLYQRQHASARMTAETSALISRAIAAALKLAQHAYHAPARPAPVEAPSQKSSIC